MKKVVIALLMSFVFGANLVVAQDPNSKLTTGVIAYDGGRYDEAIQKLNEAASKMGDLKPKYVPKLHYYLMQSYMRAVGDNANKDLKAKFPNADELALENLIKLKETLAQAGSGDANTFKAGATLNEQNLWVMFFNKGAQSYGGGNYKAALAALEKANKISPDNYLSPLMLGFAQVMNADSTNAINSLQKAIDLHEKRITAPVPANSKAEPVKADTNMVNAYLSLANLQMKFKKDPNKALETIGKGISMFPNNKKDLEITELSIYQQEPSLLQSALTKFEAATKKDPNDTRMAVAYANLLEKAGKENEALDIYRQVLTKDAKNTIANLNLGAYYVNKSAALSKEMQNVTDETKSKAMFEEIKLNFRTALPLIRQVHQNEPNEIQWVDQLVQITSYLMDDGKEMEEEFNKFVKLQTELRAKK